MSARSASFFSLCGRRVQNEWNFLLKIGKKIVTTQTSKTDGACIIDITVTMLLVLTNKGFRT